MGNKQLATISIYGYVLLLQPGPLIKIIVDQGTYSTSNMHDECKYGLVYPGFEGGGELSDPYVKHAQIC